MKRKIELSFEAEKALAVIGANIRTARLRRAETEAVLAKRLGVGRSTIGRLEKGDGGVSAALLVEALLQYGYADDLFALGDPDRDAVGKRLDAVRRPTRGSHMKHKSRFDPSSL